MESLLRSAAVISGVLLIPVVPFLLFGAAFEESVAEWAKQPNSTPIVGVVMIALLATDILLPIPSSVISTLGGWKLGWLAGTAVSWLGMTIGAMLGFLLARRWGRPFAVRFTNHEELDRMQSLSERYGAIVLIIARGVPVLAEASVLLVGVHRMSWRRFLPPIVLSNLGIAWAYSAFGDFAEQNQWLPLALGFAIALPVLLATVIQLTFGRQECQIDVEVSEDAKDAEKRG